jgi:hypothetical protein
MRRHWLNSRLGIKFVAVGLFAIAVAAPLIILQDIWFISTGARPTLWLYDEVLCYALAAVATAHLIASFFVLRPGLPKYVAVIVALSFASYVVQPFLPIHNYKHMALLSIIRTVGLCTLLSIAWEYQSDLKAKKLAR